MLARNLAVMCLVSRHQHPAYTTRSTSHPLHHRDSFLLHQARRHTIKVYSLVRADSRRPQHLYPHPRPSHLSASLLPRIPLAIVAINFHRYPSRRTIRTLLSIPSTAITMTAISFLTPLNNSNSPYMPCRRSHKIVPRGRNAAYVCSSLYIYEHTFSPIFSSFSPGLSVHAPTYGLFVRIYLFIPLHHAAA